MNIYIRMINQFYEEKWQVINIKHIHDTIIYNYKNIIYLLLNCIKQMIMNNQWSSDNELVRNTEVSVYMLRMKILMMLNMFNGVGMMINFFH